MSIATIVIIFLSVLCWVFAGMFWSIATMCDHGRRTWADRLVTLPIDAFFGTIEWMSRSFRRRK